ncbi:MAG: hypothetical protein JO257_16275 [Deltaproteobacteria bacterium]|nr:hypothetical protein [Deltaproteobacteria bacterium]
MPTRLLANFDAEVSWSGGQLSSKATARLGALAPLLSALMPQGTDRGLEIWAPAAIDAACVRWDAIGPRAALRVGTPDTWDLAWADPSAKAANDRRVTVAVQRALGVEHAHVITDITALDELRGPWVAKAPWTAAGRDRIHGDGPPRPDQRTYAERLLARNGALIVEPWLDRRFDLGVCARLERGRVIAEAPHTLVCDARGAFSGIDLAAPPLTPPQRAQLDGAVDACGRALTDLGYEGPFTVDAFVWGSGELHAPCEINARYSFGHVARALGGSRLGFGPPPAGTSVLVDSPVLTSWRA